MLYFFQISNKLIKNWNKKYQNVWYKKTIDMINKAHKIHRIKKVKIINQIVLKLT